MYDYLIIGGGIVGLSTAWQLKKARPDASVLLLEKESAFAAHQTGRNSGVIHSGIYYEPGSMKARFCRRGVSATIDFCRANGIPYLQCGKLIVATHVDEMSRLLALHQRAKENELESELLDSNELQSREPNINGCGAIYIGTTGITDFPAITRAFANRFHQGGGESRLQCEVVDITESSEAVDVALADGSTFSAKFLIACGGLMADRLARMQGIDVNFQLIPYRGTYYQLPPSFNSIVEHLIYPVPNPDLPFLGIHLTRMIDGSVTVGPSALQGWKREGYGRFNVDLGETLQILGYKGFWNASRRNLRAGLREIRMAVSKSAYVKEIQKYCPTITRRDLLPYRTGVRAMAVLPDGTMVHDFLIERSKRSLHVCSAPSPAATSAIPIGEYICGQALEPQ